MKILKAVAAVGLLSWGATAYSAPCTATSDVTNPDATLTNSLNCGLGTVNESNDSEALIGSILGGTWTFLDKDEAAGSGSAGILRSTGTNPAGSSGSWAFNAFGTFSKYVIVIKDGAVDDPADTTNPKDKYSWAWFEVDLSAGCDASSALSGFNYCGLWSMYGEDGKIKQISHLTLYGSGRRTDLPEPTSLALFGLGLVGLGVARRFRKI